jgi:hypothetical protein
MRQIMDDPKALALFQEILRKTIAKKLPWQPTAEDDKFVAPMLGKYMLTLLPYTSRDSWGAPEGPPTITLTDANNNNLAEIHSGIEGVSAQDLRTVLVFARRIAFNADEKIDELLQELQREDEQRR